jgi:hypothetical protein
LWLLACEGRDNGSLCRQLGGEIVEKVVALKLVKQKGAQERHKKQYRDRMAQGKANTQAAQHRNAS